MAEILDEPQAVEQLNKVSRAHRLLEAGASLAGILWRRHYAAGWPNIIDTATPTVPVSQVPEAEAVEVS